MTKLRRLHISSMSVMVCFVLTTACQMKMQASDSARAAETETPAIPASNPVGKTSYDAPPFSSDIYEQSWNSSPGLTPTNLFWSVVAFFSDVTQLGWAKDSSNGIAARGLIPHSGAQLWSDVFVRSLPRSQFSNPPAWVDEHYATQSEHAAWANWIQARPQYRATARDGGTLPSDWRSWGGSWGFISPNMPLDSMDNPPGMTSATYGDLFAYKWGQTAGMTGAYGVSLSDFVDSQPYLPLHQFDFNSRIISRFESALGRTLTGATQADKIQTIVSSEFTNWVDFWADSYGRFYASLAREIQNNTGQRALIIDQNGLWPSLLRLRGIDARRMLQHISSDNLVFIFDDHTMNTDRDGRSMIYAIGQSVIAAAREPNARVGANLHSDDSDFWAGVAQHWSSLPSDQQHERGLKELKRIWLEAAWSHIADRSGQVRRAHSFFQRNYWDGGTLDSQLMTLIQTIKPVRPFGLALYYSTAIEHSVEEWIAQVSETEDKAYLNPSDIVSLKDSYAVGYFVSDASLSQLQLAARPSAWIILDRTHPATNADLLPATERTKLEAIAPVLSTASAIAGFAKPLTYSTGVTGIGFYDQFNRLIVTASNLASSDTTASINLKSLPNGTFTATELFSGTQVTFTSANAQASFSFQLTRWDTKAWAIVSN